MAGWKQMFKLVLPVLVFLGSSVAATAFDPDVVPYSDKFPVEISIDDHVEVYNLAGLSLDIDVVGEGWVRAYLDSAEVETVERLGYKVKRIPNQALRMWRSLKEQDTGTLIDVYHDYDAVTAYLEGVVADHPSITRLISIGESVQGRNLWFVKITDNPDIEEDEPEFKYISTMHGDEPVGTENCLKFIDLLTDNYDSGSPDSSLKRLVDEIEIWIMPMMNPDGNAAGSRYNASGADLNRDFPDWVNDPDNTPAGREPETQAVMIFSDSMTFDLSANFHGGALVVNYPWDNRPARPPDDTLYIEMSEAYSVHNLPMWNSPTFYHGVTNGWDWYEAHGTMQDWNYDWAYNMEVTIELDDVKWPPTSRLPQLWDDNDKAMVAYMECCLWGVRGVVTDSASGAPLAATILVSGLGWNDRTDLDVGDYHRILRPGSYTLTFFSPGYVTRHFPGVVVTSDSATVLDVEMSPAVPVTVSGTVSSDLGSPLAAHVAAYNHLGGELADSTTSNGGDGSYTLGLLSGEYDFRVKAPGYRLSSRYANVVGDSTLDFVLEPTVGSVLVVDDDSGSRLLGTDKDGGIETLQMSATSAATAMAADLELLGYDVAEEPAAATDPGLWHGYDLLVWSSGYDISPIASSAYRSNLIAYVAAGGKLLIEGGELAYDAVSSPGYPNFADSVLHSDSWNGDDVGDLTLAAGQTGHPIATTPNALPGTIGITYSGWGAEDAANPAGDSYIIYGTASHPADGGVLVHDDAGTGEGQVVFFAFAYSALTAQVIARGLLENVAAYLIEDVSGAPTGLTGSQRPAISLVSSNPFSRTARFSLVIPARQHVRLGVYDVRGRRIRGLLDGVVAECAHEVEWDGTDDAGRGVSAGIYFCSLESSQGTMTHKVVIIK